MFRTFERLRQLPADTVVYGGHEYTLSNLRFAQQLMPDSEAVANMLLWAQQQREQQLPTVPTTLQQEYQHNMFLQCATPEDLRLLREMKDVA